MKGQNLFARAALAVAIVCALLSISNAAHAFCGFYVSSANGDLTNDATQVVLMRDGTRTVLSMQNQYKGPPQDFAMVVPVPVVLQKENVKTLSRDAFDKVDRLGAPRLVEYWEQDPCAPLIDEDKPTMARGQGAGIGFGRLGGSGGGVQIEASFSVGEYEIVILSAQDSGALDTWLRQNSYKIPANAEPLLRPYVAAGSKFFVAKVNAAKVNFVPDTTSAVPNAKRAELSPLRFYFDSETFSLPVKLGLLNSGGTQDLVVNILAPHGQRYVVANMPNATIPTNLDVTDATRAAFPAFYAALFDKTLEKNPGAVVTEYAWGTSSCDPCPTNVSGLVQNDLATLGADVLPSSVFGKPHDAHVTIRQGAVSVNGSLPSEIVTRIMRQNFARFRLCYDKGREADSSLTGGSVTLKFVIDAHGSVKAATEVGSPKFPDARVSECMTKAITNVSFPAPEAGNVVVVYPITFSSPPMGADGGLVDVLQSVPPDFVLTRLHARYGKDALGNDLVFQKAAPIVGGREAYASPDPSVGASPVIERGVHTEDTNNFQARYVIRHPFKGPITCKDPHHGIWGGPPSGTIDNGTVSATKIGLAKRGSVELASFVTSGPLTFDAMPAVSALPASASARAAPNADASPAPPGAPSTGASKGHCNFSAGESAHDRGAWVVALAFALGGWSRRRRSRA